MLGGKGREKDGGKNSGLSSLSDGRLGEATEGLLIGSSKVPAGDECYLVALVFEAVGPTNIGKLIPQETCFVNEKG